VTGESGDGRTLTRVPAVRLFAFAWQDAYGPDAFVLADCNGPGGRRVTYALWMASTILAARSSARSPSRASA